MLQTHYFDLLSKNFGKSETFITVLKQNNGEPSVIVWRILQICKTDVVRLLILVVRDSVITLSEIAYNVNNNLDKVLLVMVWTVYHGNIINSSRLVPKVAVTRAFCRSWLTCFGTSDKLDRMLKVSIPHSFISR